MDFRDQSYICNKFSMINIAYMYCRTMLKSMCLSIRGPVMWNKRHSDLKNSTTVNMF